MVLFKSLQSPLWLPASPRRLSKGNHSTFKCPSPSVPSSVQHVPHYRLWAGVQTLPFPLRLLASMLSSVGLLKTARSGQASTLNKLPPPRLTTTRLTTSFHTLSTLHPGSSHNDPAKRHHSCVQPTGGKTKDPKEKGPW